MTGACGPWESNSQNNCVCHPGFPRIPFRQIQLADDFRYCRLPAISD